ncbi:hypothetical protein [Streptomyces kaniharaensis]|uniref:hypothetical protein n=1 Tax=Streptomyces kaniharaensis TaxID=212423 RepID=UPI001E5729C6|nr:hypothetical protein [Streptomyces kaniharaensis]
MPPKAGTPAPAGFMWIEDAAKELGVQVCTLHKWRYRGIGPAAALHAGRLIYAKSGIKSYWESLANPELKPTRVPRPHVRRAA